MRYNFKMRNKQLYLFLAFNFFSDFIFIFNNRYNIILLSGAPHSDLTFT